ncbi:MAG: SDR family oxidoreductase [Bryobacteraceae bacterium]|jgi:NAD(P)-dependent dehydrogenase (short-subunit alcohol dehydrogenase family)
MPNLFDLTGRVAIITGGAGLLGEQHARVIAQAGGIPVLVDICSDRAGAKARAISEEFGVSACAITANIADRNDVERILHQTLEQHGRVDILINNAANNPRVEQSSEVNFSRFENFPVKQWTDDLSVGLTGAFLCSQVIGSEMARRRKGVIVNVASDLALIGPDQRLYRQEGLPDHLQPVKPVTYSVVKSGLIGLTRYLATYWADHGVRVNAISPGGVYNGQPEGFLSKLSSLIPLGRMANVDEYQGAMLFLCSDASSYMTGSNLVVDGGRTCW